ncbi:MAG TPA: cyclic nucleotide-binding domain-containing protein, partial [Chloroflexota bacterium]|nr:cyclic nucleotide-binding domain-containing protein [Chloroflexota bacterium]
GELLPQEGEEATRFYLIRGGRVRLEIYTPERGLIVIQTLSEGDVLGWSWLAPPYRWSLDAQAIELTRAIVRSGS